MSHQTTESARGTAKEPTIEYSDSTRSTPAGHEAYGDPAVYGSNPNPHDDVAKFGRDTHVNQDSVIKDRADGKDRLGNDAPNMTGSSAKGDLSGTSETLTHGGNQQTSTFSSSTTPHVHDSTCGHDTNIQSAHTHNPSSTGPISTGSHSHDHNNKDGLENASSTGGGLLGNLKSHKVDGASSLDTTKSTGKTTFDGPVDHNLTGHSADQQRTGAFGTADVGGSGVGTGIRSDYDALGNRVGPGHREGHTFADENHGEKVGIVDKLKSKLGMNSGDERHGDFSSTDEHGSTHAGGQGGAGRI